MQIKTFMIPLLGAETIEEEINAFLCSHRVLTVDRQFSAEGGDYGNWGTQCSVSSRNGANIPSNRYASFGFRLALSPSK